MPEEKTKSLEMRVAELEDKLSKLHITEEEWKAYRKVSSLVGGGAAPAQAASPALGILNRCAVVCYCYCIITQPVAINDCIPQLQSQTITAEAGGFGTLGS